jgi:hypothetical protein
MCVCGFLLLYSCLKLFFKYYSRAGRSGRCISQCAGPGRLSPGTERQHCATCTWPVTAQYNRDRQVRCGVLYAELEICQIARSPGMGLPAGPGWTLPAWPNRDRWMLMPLPGSNGNNALPLTDFRPALNRQHHDPAVRARKAANPGRPISQLGVVISVYPDVTPDIGAHFFGAVISE